MNITEESKSQFQETLNKISSETRMEMIQLGLNPFLESDVEKYWVIRANAKRLPFKERVIAAFQLLFKKKITDKLFAHVLCKINDEMQKGDTEAYLDKVGKEGEINPLVEKLEKKEPNSVSKVAPLYTESIKEALIDRYAKAVENGEISSTEIKNTTINKVNNSNPKPKRNNNNRNRKRKKPQSPSNTKNNKK